MARKRREEEHENHERWLVSYADFVTLLFAFFVVMYSLSQINEGKYRVLSDALIQAFKPATATPKVVTSVPGAQSRGALVPAGVVPQMPMRHGGEVLTERARLPLDQIAVLLNDALGPLVDTGKVRVSMTDRGLTVDINASVLFASAEAALAPEANKILGRVADVLAPLPNAVEVEGHTDNEPIATAQFPSNWELSGARASSVVRLFIERGIAAPRLSATGLADTRPEQANDTPEGRSRNRRVTVLLRPGA